MGLDTALKSTNDVALYDPAPTSPDGFQPLSLLYDKETKRYLVAAALQQTDLPCNAHPKMVTATFTAPATGLLKTGDVVQAAGDGVWFPTVAQTDQTDPRYVVLFLQNPLGSPAPQTGTVQLWGSPNGEPATWLKVAMGQACSGACPGGGLCVNGQCGYQTLPFRPAILAEVGGLWLAWTEPAAGVRVLWHSWTQDASTGIVLGKGTAHPALARHPNNWVALARVESDNRVLVSLLDRSGSQVSAGPPVVASGDLPAAVARSGTALAAGPYGFGVVWVEGQGPTAEVKFRHLSCQP